MVTGVLMRLACAARGEGCPAELSVLYFVLCYNLKIIKQIVLTCSVPISCTGWSEVGVTPVLQQGKLLAEGVDRIAHIPKLVSVETQYDAGIKEGTSELYLL